MVMGLSVGDVLSVKFKKKGTAEDQSVCKVTRGPLAGMIVFTTGLTDNEIRAKEFEVEVTKSCKTFAVAKCL